MTDSQFERIRILALTTSDPPDDWREILDMLVERILDQQSEIDQLEDELDEDGSVDALCDCDDVADDVRGLQRRVGAIEKLIGQATKAEKGQ
jgi:HPt (histidine-containing phosphotransfer) domain-containing protein